jgi:multidrug efflux pump subunit AcrA (membrane-fusion protein)
MNKPARRWLIVVSVALAVSFAIVGGIHYSRSHKQEFVVPPLEDEPEVAKAKRQPMSEILPAYGVVIGGGAELTAKVAIETDDAPKVRVGESVSVRSSAFPSRQGRVARFLGGAVPETGQGIAWIEFPNADGKDHAGDFVWVSIKTNPGKPTLVVPASAIVTKEEKTWVVVPKKGEKDKVTYLPVEIEIGRANGEETEVLKGLDEDTDVVVSGAVGYLYPDFKAGAGD